MWVQVPSSAPFCIRHPILRSIGFFYARKGDFLMKVAVMQASSQKAKNWELVECVHAALAGREAEVLNFGVFEDEEEDVSYVEAALLTALLLESRAVDRVVTGCSSGEGMALACNSFAGCRVGYITSRQDAFLFGRINDGNVFSFALKEGWGALSAAQITDALEGAFAGAFGEGFPPEEAARKRKDTTLLKQIQAKTRRPLAVVLYELESELVARLLKRHNVIDYVLAHGHDHYLRETLVHLLEKTKREEEDAAN